MNRLHRFTAAILVLAIIGTSAEAAESEVKQITFGPQHHFFGYFGHVRTVPWNASGRFILSLRTNFQERMPKPEDAAEIVLLDAKNGYAEQVVDRTRAWNFQQGTMLYWNPRAAETQFFFNDRDPMTGEVFCVLFDITKGTAGERVTEYRFHDTPIGTSGVCQQGGWFAGINYGRLARLRPVTGYPEARDWTVGRSKNPEDDGVFKVNVVTKEKQLLVSYRQLADVLRNKYPNVDEQELFINHTLWSRNDGRLFFFARADFDVAMKRIDAPFTMKADGSELRPLREHIGGHPEWESDTCLIGSRAKRQILFDVDAQKVTGTIGDADSFPNPGGDIALSPDGKLFVNGHGSGGSNFYTILRRSDGAIARTEGFNQDGYTSGELRIDPSPNWNRDGTQLLVVAIDKQKSRQIFLVSLRIP